MPLNCNLMRHNLFFKVIYTRCVGGKRRGRSLVFSLRVKLAGGHFHVYELHTWLLGAVETGDKKKKSQLAVFTVLLQQTEVTISKATH